MSAAHGAGVPPPTSPATARLFAAAPFGLQRQHCYLCDLPRTPWALLQTDYSEPVCRGCVNYEGADRVEVAIEAARRLKQALGGGAESCRPPSRLPPAHMLGGPPPPSSRPGDDGLRVPTRAHAPPDVVVRARPPIDFSGIPPPSAGVGCQRAVLPPPSAPPPSHSLARSHHRPDELRSLASSVSTSNSSLLPPPPPPRFSLPGGGIFPGQLDPTSLPLSLVRGVDQPTLNGKRSEGGPTGRSLLSPTGNAGGDSRMSNNNGPEVVSPSTVVARSRLVVETLATLSCATPFDVRLKMDSAVVGRVLAFDAAKPGGLGLAGVGLGIVGSAGEGEPFQLAMFVELPIGSGLVYGCCGDASPSGWQGRQSVSTSTNNDQSLPELSAFRHLEYRLKPDADEWRPLADLLPEGVRHFREPLVHGRLPALGRPPLSLDAAASGLGAALGYRWSAAAALQLQPLQAAAAARSFQFPSLLPPGVSRKRKLMSVDGLDGCDQTSSNLHGRLDLAADGLALKRRLWMQSQADALRLALSFPAAVAMAAHDGIDVVGNGSNNNNNNRLPFRRSNSSSPPNAAHHRRPADDDCDVDGDPRVDDVNDDGLPEIDCVRSPSSPPLGCGGVSAGGSPVRPTSGGKMLSMPADVVGSAIVTPRCTLCNGRLEDTHFVQCPSVPDHKFCFPCSRDSIKTQLANSTAANHSGGPAVLPAGPGVVVGGGGSEVYCPSGNKCPLLPGVPGGVPWAFMSNEIETILAGGVSAATAAAVAAAEGGGSVGGTSSCGSNGTAAGGSAPDIEDRRPTTANDVKIKKERDA